MIYYNTNPGQPQFVDAEWIKQNTSLDPEKTPPSALAAAGFYLRVVIPEGGYNSQLVNVTQTAEIVEYDYVITLTATPFSGQTYTNSVYNTSYALLEGTDWLVTRKAEDGTPIPEDWATWRESVRTAAQEKITAIEATTTEEELKTYVLSPEYSAWPFPPAEPPENRPIVSGESVLS
jgi:hypothetical protein